MQIGLHILSALCEDSSLKSVPFEIKLGRQKSENTMNNEDELNSKLIE